MPIDDIVITTTTDTAEQVTAALEGAGVSVEVQPDAAKGKSGAGSGPADKKVIPNAKSDSDDESEAASGSDADDAESEAESGEETESESESESETESETDDKGKTLPVAAKADQDATPPKKKGGFQKRIDKLTRDVGSRDAEIMRLRTQISQAARPTEQKPVQQQAAQLPAAPDPNDAKFTTYADYLTAQGKWVQEFAKAAVTEAQKSTAVQLANQFNEMRATQDAQQAMTVIEKNFVERQGQAREVFPDYDTMIAAGADVEISPVIHQVMLTHPEGAKLAYWIANPDNHEEVERIGQLPHGHQMLELGPILKDLKGVKAGTTTKPNATKAKASKSAKPLGRKSVGAGSGNTATVKNYEYYENASYDEYKAARNSGTLR